MANNRCSLTVSSIFSFYERSIKRLIRSLSNKDSCYAVSTSALLEMITNVTAVTSGRKEKREFSCNSAHFYRLHSYEAIMEIS